VPQGSRCAATLGYLTKSLRDKNHPNYHKAGLSLHNWNFALLAQFFLDRERRLCQYVSNINRAEMPRENPIFAGTAGESHALCDFLEICEVL
jgi:hypothetical protein